MIVNWRDEIDSHLSMLSDNLTGPGWLYGYERHFWIDLWRVPVFEAVEDHGIELRHYGPVRAFVIAAEPRARLFNLVLGASRPGAVAEGHLAGALDWTESLGVDCRIPVRSDFGEPGAAEDLLNQRGYRRTSSQALFIRGNGPPDFPAPPGIEIEQLTEPIEGFDDLLGAGYGMGWAEHGFFVGLPGRDDWRSYLSVDEEKNEAIGGGVMMLHYEVAQLGFAATRQASRGKGAHLALLRRRILDALAAGSRRFFALTEELLDCPGNQSIAARNLVRAGFRRHSTRTVWRPPEELIADDDDPDGEADENGLGDEFDDHHGFELEG